MKVTLIPIPGASAPRKRLLPLGEASHSQGLFETFFNPLEWKVAPKVTPGNGEKFTGFIGDYALDK